MAKRRSYNRRRAKASRKSGSNYRRSSVRRTNRRSRTRAQPIRIVIEQRPVTPLMGQHPIDENVIPITQAAAKRAKY